MDKYKLEDLHPDLIRSPQPLRAGLSLRGRLRHIERWGRARGRRPRTTGRGCGGFDCRDCCGWGV